MQICKGKKKKTGDACRAPAGPGGLCFLHANPDSAKTLGQIGGRKNRRSAGVDLQVPDNMTATDLRNVEVQAIRLLLSGDLQAREASALAQLCNSLHRVILTADLETRVATLEEEVAQRERESPPEGHSSGSNMTETGAAAGSDAQLGAEQQIPPDGDPTESHMTEIGAVLGTDAELAEPQTLCPNDAHGSGEAEKP